MLKRYSVYSLLIFILLGSCMTSSEDDDGPNPNDFVVFLVIHEDSIENDKEPNNFSGSDVNNQVAEIGQRSQLKFFKENVGKTIELNTGEVGDEGWFALKSIPNRWVNAGPTEMGLQNYLEPGPGLGSPNIDDDRDVLLDEIPDVTPLRATGLKMLVGYKVMAVVYDSDISINYAPLEGNLQGANLGMVAFEVLSVRKRDDNDSSLPAVSVKILDVNALSDFGKVLFSNAPEPQSSSKPFDVRPPISTTIPILIQAN